MHDKRISLLRPIPQIDAIQFPEMKITRIDKQIQEMTTIRNKLQEIVDKSCTGNCPLDKVLAQL